MSDLIRWQPMRDLLSMRKQMDRNLIELLVN